MGKCVFFCMCGWLEGAHAHGCVFMCVSERDSARLCVLDDVCEMLEWSRCKLRKSIRLEKELWRWLEGEGGHPRCKQIGEGKGLQIEPHKLERERGQIQIEPHNLERATDMKGVR